VEKDMIRQIACAFLVVGFAAALAPQAYAAGNRTALQVLDPDNDGTVDLAEAKAAATSLFDKLDRDHDGTLDQRELKGRLSVKDFKAADPDNDGTLDKDEYLAVVEKQFNAANPDNDGTLDAKELGSKSGLALQRLVK
jgi:Ca2+-binding EF-hand superfamily protein